MGDSVIVRGVGGRSVAVDAEDLRIAREERERAEAPPPRRYPPGSISFKRAQEIRGYYARATASRVKSFGPTSFDVGGGKTDQEAFDACVENFGFRHSVEALKLVSERAKCCAANPRRAP